MGQMLPATAFRTAFQAPEMPTKATFSQKMLIWSLNLNPDVTPYTILFMLYCIFLVEYCKSLTEYCILFWEYKILLMECCILFRED